ncbi:MAG: DUF4292 domain-containing protein [Ignavibacteria bacterium]
MLIKTKLLLPILSLVFIFTDFAFPFTQQARDSISTQLEILQKTFAIRNQLLTSLNAEGNISFDTPSMSNDGSLTLSIHQPDSAFVFIEGPFGIDIAKILLTRNNFIYQNIYDNYVIRGYTTRDNIRILLKIDLEFDEIMNAFTGSFNLIDSNTTEWRLKDSADVYILSFKNKFDNRYRLLVISKSTFDVKKFIKNDLLQKQELIIEYSDYIVHNKVSIPGKITISRPASRQFVYITYEKTELNPGALKFKMVIPKSAKQYFWK